jgi:hypothetical protein
MKLSNAKKINYFNEDALLVHREKTPLLRQNKLKSRSKIHERVLKCFDLITESSQELRIITSSEIGIRFDEMLPNGYVRPERVKRGMIGISMPCANHFIAGYS